MDKTVKTAVIAPRGMSAAALPEDWTGQIGDIEGLTVTGNVYGRLRVHATDEALRTARAKFGDCLLVEEEMPRTMP